MDLTLQEAGTAMIASDKRLAPAFGRLLTLMVDTPQLDDFLDEVVRLAADVVTPAAAGSITVNRDGAPVTVGVSDPLAAQVDEIQYGADEGPCLDALRHGYVIQVDDLSLEKRWDTYRPHAIAHGVVSSVSVPLTVGSRTLGALNLYAHEPAAFAGSPRRYAEAFAAQCAAALTIALRQADQADLQLQLTKAMASRSVIDQALGILMGQQRCTADEAFDILRGASQRRNRKLRDVAAGIVKAVTGQPPRTGSGFRTPGDGADAS
jgi:GAF domain-containing protein